MVLIVLVGAQPECLVTSDSFDLRFGVPHGSCLGPRTASLTTRNFTCLSVLTVLGIK